MTIQHHPTGDLLLAYAAGTLDQAQHAALATHQLHCPQCRGQVRDMEVLGGDVLETLPPAAIAPSALAAVEARLASPTCPREVAARTYCTEPGLPAFVQRLPAPDWKWIAPGLHLRPINLAHGGDTRLFLLRSKPGARFLPHGHSGLEMTCVLTGSFSHDGGRYGPGDFDFGDCDTEHAIAIGEEAPCISLVAMQGKLQMRGLVGRMFQPFLAL